MSGEVAPGSCRLVPDGQGGYTCPVCGSPEEEQAIDRWIDKQVAELRAELDDGDD